MVKDGSRLMMGLTPYFAMEANLKDLTNFQTLLQVCQIYDRKLKVMHMGVDITVVIASANVVPTLSTPHLSCIVHEGKVFPNIFNSTITNQASIPMMRDVDHPRIDGSFPEQLNRRLDELTNNFRQIHHCDSSSSFSNVPIKALSLSKTKWCLQIMSIVNFLKCSTFVSV